MKACLRSLSRVALAAALVAGVGVTAALAQGEWKAPADAKATKNPLADKKADKAGWPKQEAGRDQLRHLSRRQRQGRRRRRRRTAAAEAGRLDVGEDRLGDRRRAVLEDQQRPRRHAPVEASARQGSLGARQLHPHAAEEVAARIDRSSRRPAGARRRGVRRIRTPCAWPPSISAATPSACWSPTSGPGGAPLRVDRERPARHAAGRGPRGLRPSRRRPRPSGPRARGGVRRRAPAPPAPSEWRSSPPAPSARPPTGRDFAAALERAAGERVRVISGRGGSRASRCAASSTASAGRRTASTLLFDIGGGSTEYVLARGRDGGRPRSACVSASSISPSAIRSRRGGLAAVSGAPATRSPAASPASCRRRSGRRGRRRVVGTAGTVTTLAALDLGLTTYDRARVQGHMLQRTAVERQLQRLGALTARRARRLAVPGARARRPDRAGRRRGPGHARPYRDPAVVSDAALREGVVLQLSAGRA